MTLTLHLKPKLEQHLQQVAQERGMSVLELLEQDLEQRWLEDPLAKFASIGLGESDLGAKDSKIWLRQEWDKKL
jgi:hypothetical protein